MHEPKTCTPHKNVRPLSPMHAHTSKTANSNASIPEDGPTDELTAPGLISREHARKIFDIFDDDKSGTLSLSQFSAACYCLIEHSLLRNLDIVNIFETIDDDDSNGIDFEEFYLFVEPASNAAHSLAIQNHNHLSEAFAATVLSTEESPSNGQVKRKYPSPTPPKSTFDSEYVSRFYSRDMGVQLMSGLHGMNAYVKWRFTEHARNNISSGSKLIEVNGKCVDNLCYDEIINFLHIVIITEHGFCVKFKPASLLQNDTYRPYDFTAILNDNIKDSELLKPTFDKKKQRRKSLRKMLSNRSSNGMRMQTQRGNNINMDLSVDYSSSTKTTDAAEFSLTLMNNEGKTASTEEMLETIENVQIPACWFRLPRILQKLLCIVKIEKISQLRKYHTHCRHCPQKAQKCRSGMHMLLDNEKYNKCSYAIQVFIMITIIISTLAYVIETLPVFANNSKAVFAFTMIEYIVSLIFTLEYLLRIIAARNICVLFWDPLNLIDFIAIIPFWIELISGAEGSNALRVIRVIRLARIFRLMKSPRFAEYMEILQTTIVASAGSFGLLLTLIFLEIIVASSLVYVCEAYRDDPDNLFTSIPATSWWAFVTVTTVGYGDMVPQSVLGRIICVFTLFSGLLVIALPVIIIGGNFEVEYRKYEDRKSGWSLMKKRDMGPHILTVARLLHFINHQRAKDIFEWQDVKDLHEEGLESFEIINRVLLFEHGHVYLPSKFDAYKKYALFQFYGKPLRDRAKRISSKRKNGVNGGMRTSPHRTQSQPPPLITDKLNMKRTIRRSRRRQSCGNLARREQKEEEHAEEEDKKWSDIMHALQKEEAANSSSALTVMSMLMEDELTDYDAEVQRRKCRGKEEEDKGVHVSNSSNGSDTIHHPKTDHSHQYTSNFVHSDDD